MKIRVRRAMSYDEYGEPMVGVRFEYASHRASASGGIASSKISRDRARRAESQLFVMSRAGEKSLPDRPVSPEHVTDF